MKNIRLDSSIEHASRVFMAKVSDRYAVSSAIVFGSRARGDHRLDSDTDIAVVLRGHRGRFLATKLELADIAYDVLLETGVLIQPLPLWEDEWAHPEHHTNPALLRNIHRQGVAL